METIAQVVEDFFFHCQYEKNLSIKTLKAYKTDLSQFIDFYSKISCSDKISDIDKDIIKQYIKNLSEKNKPKTIKRKIATLKTFFNHLEFEDVILTNPFHKIKIKTNGGKQLPRIIELSIIKKIFKHIYSQKKKLKDINSKKYVVIIRDIAVIELLFSTGLRVSELCNLNEKNIDINKGTLFILGKGNRERIVPVCTPEAKAALKEYYQLFCDKIAIHGHFFINQWDSRLSEQSVRFMIRKYIRELKIEQNITPHMFRHTIATLLLECDVDIRYIQNLLGHSTISTTEIYTHVNHKAQRRILTRKHPRKHITF
ncbi:tyrosine-type recombinase/integrase [Candidatus Parcubacteria bacterium]|nr:tyrosine-type recombinase/integrase [Candidatus Parcubacteria bacterium]